MDEFAAALASQRSAATVRAYVAAIRAFIAAAPADYTCSWRDSVAAHLQRLDAAGKAPSTRDQALAALDAFGAWSGLGVTGLPRSAKPTPTPQPLAPREAEFVYGELLRPSAGPVHARALAALLLTTGTKLGEALAMNVDDVELRGRAAVVAHGRPSERILELQHPVVDLLRPLVNRVPPETPLFRRSDSSRRPANERLDPRTARLLVHEVSGRHPHALTDTPRVTNVVRRDHAAFYRESGLARTAIYRYAEAAGAVTQGTT
jgi:integrase